MNKSLAQNRFHKLVDDISRLYTNARKAQIQFAWETGRRIVEEEQNGQIRAEYGTQLIAKLSKELRKMHGDGFSETTLADMRLLYLRNPIFRPVGKLTWSHYIQLSRIPDEKTRHRLEDRIQKENLTREQVRQIVLNIRQGTSREVTSEDRTPLKRPTDLNLNTFAKSKLSVKLEEGKVLLDCGFFVNWPVAKNELSQLNIVGTPSYTYAATVDRVVDGDTLLVLVEVGFGIISRYKLRLRGINCAELGTPDGEKAKKVVSGLLAPGSIIVLKSHKTDLYGRFVADVFYLKDEDNPQKIIKEGSYLNQQLLDEKLAVRMQE